MKIIIVRHAQTDENIKGGDAKREFDVLLNEEGIKQAGKLAERLRAEKISHAYVSTQTRAVQTAKEVLKHHHQAKLEKTEHLSEQNLGDYASLPKNVIKELRVKSGHAFHMFRPEKGESYADLQDRAVKFFHNLLKKHSDDDTLLIVSHGGTLGALMLHLLEKEFTEENYKAHKPDNSAVTVLDISKDGKVDMKVFNDLGHLNNRHNNLKAKEKNRRAKGLKN